MITLVSNEGEQFKIERDEICKLSQLINEIVQDTDEDTLIPLPNISSKTLRNIVNNNFSLTNLNEIVDNVLAAHYLMSDSLAKISCNNLFNYICANNVLDEKIIDKIPKDAIIPYTGTLLLNVEEDSILCLMDIGFIDLEFFESDVKILKYIITNNYIRVLDILLDDGLDVNYDIGGYNKLIHIAVSENKLEIVELLIDNDADIEFESDYYTLLELAINNSNFDMTKLLVDSGCNLNIKIKEYILSYNPLEYCCINYRGDKESLDIIILLMDNKLDYFDWGPPYLHAFLWSECNNEDLAVDLIERNYNLHEIEHEGNTSLICAILSGSEEIALTLIEKGVNVNHVNNKGKTALDYAIEYEYDEIIQLISKQNK